MLHAAQLVVLHTWHFEDVFILNPFWQLVHDVFVLHVLHDESQDKHFPLDA